MRILLVDDDDSILISLAATLKSLPGHELRLATSGEEALKLAGEMGGVDLVVSDVVMDPMDGFALRDAMLERHPGMRTIFITGYDLSDYAEQTEGHQLLQKPFEPADLLAAVRKEVGDSAPPVATPAVAEETPAPPPPVAPPTPAPVPEPVAAIPPPPLAPEPVAAPIAPAEIPATPEPAPKVAATAAPPVAPSAPAEPVARPAAPVAQPATPAVPMARPSTPATQPASPAVPVARPSAPAAQPAIPVARPVAQPISPASPQAVPAAATPVARPTAQPTATPRAATVATHNPPTAQPTAAAPGQPRAIARPVAAQPTATAVPAAAPQTPRASAPAPTAVAKAVPAAAAVVATATATAAMPQPKPVPTANPAPGAVTPAKSTQKMAAPMPSPVAASAAAMPTVKAAVPVPVAKAATAVPVAKPAGPVPVARPGTAVPVAKAAVPTATAAPAAKAGPAPIGKPTVAPQGKPAAIPANPGVATAPRVGTPQAPTPPDTSNLPAKTIGAYDIHHRLGVGRWGAVYAAVQTAINRPVALKILDPERAKDETQVQNFTADARAKASVQNPSILAVYEAGEQDGHIFYTREYVAGRNLAEVESSGSKIDEPTALKILRIVGEGLAYFQAQNTPHTALEARSIYLGTDGQPRLANLAAHAVTEPQTFQQEVQTLGKVLLGVLPAAQKLSPGLRGLLSRMVQTAEGNPKSFPAWAPLLHAVKTLEPQAVPAEAAKISASDRAAVAALDAARKAQKRSIYLTVGSAVSLVALVGFLIWFFMLRGAERSHDEMVQIPGGEFLFQSGDTMTVPEFWIDKYEVTIGQFAEFLNDLDEHPRGQYPDLYERIEHPNQPPLKRVEGGHRPPNWHIFYPRAKGKMEVASTPTSLDSPVVEVDWWSAYAYAKWRGRELPTEQEWEKAARGTKGFAFPWGEEADPKRANTGADYNGGNPNAKAEIDGFIRYGDVDKQSDDKSPFGVIGMAGNVSEWILDWAVGSDKRTKFPVIKGGSFRDPDVRLDRRIIGQHPGTAEVWLGFRTVSHTAPKK